MADNDEKTSSKPHGLQKYGNYDNTEQIDAEDRERIAKEKAEKIAEEEKLNAESERAERNKKITWIVLEIALFVSFILGVIGVCTVGTVSNILATIGGIGIIASGIIMRIMEHFE